MQRALCVRVRADNKGIHLRREPDCANAKTKCIHPDRPMSKACPDCPRRGKFVAALEQQFSDMSIEAMAGKTKCIHADRPMSKACPDCPRRKKMVASLDGATEEPTAPCVCSM